MKDYGFDSSWQTLPITVAINAVMWAIQEGDFGQTAVDIFTNVDKIPATLVKQGTSPLPPGLQFYEKADIPDVGGKFQYIGDDGPYKGGWEIRLWSPNWDVQEPQWQIHPFGQVDPNYQLPTPEPAPTPDDVLNPPHVDAEALEQYLDAQFAAVNHHIDAAKQEILDRINTVVRNAEKSAPSLISKFADLLKG